MKRSLLFIVMAIGFVAAYVGGATFAPFTDEQTATTGVTAGTLVFGGNPTQSVTLSNTDLTDCDGTGEGFEGMYPGEECTGTLTITNNGSLSAYIQDFGPDDIDVDVGESDCGEENWLLTVDLDDGSDSYVSFPAGDSQDLIISLMLLPEAGNECQGESASVTVVITISQSPDPHDQSDDGSNVGPDPVVVPVIIPTPV